MEYPENITFKREIYGFESIRDFKLTKASEKEDNPFMLLKAKDDSVTFVLLDPKMFDENYAPPISQELANILEIKASDNIITLAIVVIPNSIEEMTINLRSPIIINRDSGNAVQLILDDERYSVRHKILNS